MQTQCPHCRTRFRVTETQVNIADGLVRCGVCSEVFNAFEAADQGDHQSSLLNDENLPAQKSEDDLAQSVSPDAQGTSRENDNIDSDIEADADSFDLAGIPATEDSTKDDFDFFDESSNESLSYVVPEQFRDSHTARAHSVISTLLWSAGILLLTTTLLIEYVWFNREQFNHVPELQALIEKLCQHVECETITTRDPSKIELVSRNVYSHPNEKNALMVNVTMKNNADFAQPYPVMQIEFSDIRGGTVAARRFLPDEYLPVAAQQANAEQPRMLLPNTSSSITLEIQDPGKQAMTYEFNFL
jgi:predicted Zn finger-like uncharacterized protein